MREILFRGKRLDNGEWLCGDLRQVCPYFEGDTATYIMSPIPGSKSSFINYPVDPSTIGQYTGLCDKNGVRIFGGDIVEVTDDFGEISSSDCGYGKVIFLDGMWYIDEDVNNSLININNVYYIEVIGNFHDNPELLEVEG